MEIENIGTMVNNEPDDIFVCAGSHETRCLGSVRKLETSYKAKGVFILKYSHKNEEREKHLTEMRSILKEVGTIKEFLVDEEMPIPVINEIIQEMVQYIKNLDHPKIIIDISTLIKWHLLILLKALDSKGLLNKCRFIYTEPEDYIIELFQPLSFGIKEIFPIPLFSGNFDFAKDCLLVIMLGYEGDRAMGLLENIDPTECLLLIPKPAYHPEWEGRTEEIEPYLSNQLFYLSGTTMEGASTDLLRSLIDYLRKESISTDLVVVPDSWEEATRGPLFGIHGFCIHNLCKEWFLGIFVTKPWLFKYMAMYLESGVFPLKSVLARYLARNREDLSLEVAEYLGLVFLTQIWRANKSYFMDERSDIPLPSPKTRFVQDLRPENRIGGENYTNSYPVRSVRVNGDAVFVEIN